MRGTTAPGPQLLIEESSALSWTTKRFSGQPAVQRSSATPEKPGGRIAGAAHRSAAAARPGGGDSAAGASTAAWNSGGERSSKRFREGCSSARSFVAGRSLAVSLPLLILGLTAAVAEGRALRIAACVPGQPPFVNISANGKLFGYDIDLWSQIYQSARHKAHLVGGGLDEYFVSKRTPPILELTFEEILESLRNATIDVGICAVYVAADRISYMDYTVPYKTSGYRAVVAVSRDTVTGAEVFQKAFRVPSAWATWAFLGVLTLGIAYSHMFWYIESPHNIHIRKEYGPGVFDAWWLAVVAAMTVGYGEKHPRTVVGKLLTVWWFFVATHIILLIGAAMTSDFLAHNGGTLRFDLDSLEDMKRYRTVGVTHTNAGEFLRSYGFNESAGWDGVILNPSSNWDHAYEMLSNGTTEILLDDMLSAQYTLGKTQPAGRVFALVGPEMGRLQASFGISRPNGEQHPCLSVINQAVTEYVAGDKWVLLDQLQRTWFGVIEGAQAIASYEAALQSVLEDWNSQYAIWTTVAVMGWLVFVFIHYRREIREARMKGAILKGMGLGKKFSREELAKGSQILFETMDEDLSGKVSLEEITKVLSKLSTKLNYRHIRQVVHAMQNSQETFNGNRDDLSFKSNKGNVLNWSSAKARGGVASLGSVGVTMELDLAQFQELMEVIFFRTLDGEEQLSAPARRRHAQQTHLDFKHNAWASFSQLLYRISELEAELAPQLVSRHSGGSEGTGALDSAAGQFSSGGTSGPHTPRLVRNRQDS